MTHQPLYFIIHYMNNGHVSWWLIAEEYWKLFLIRFTSLFSMAQQWSRDTMTNRRGIYFWKTISLAHLFLCSATQYKIIFRNLRFKLLRHDRTTLPLNHITSDSYWLCSHTCKPPHSTWHHDTSTHIGHAPSEWWHHFLTPALIANVFTSSHWHLHSDLPRAHWDMHAHIKVWFAHVNYDSFHV